MAKIEIPKPNLWNPCWKSLHLLDCDITQEQKKHIILFGDLYEMILYYVKALVSCHFQAKLLREITDIVTMKNCPNPKQQIYQHFIETVY